MPSNGSADSSDIPNLGPAAVWPQVFMTANRSPNDFEGCGYRGQVLRMMEVPLMPPV
jgi:hypothetical protein